MALKENIKRKRLELHLTLEELSKKLGVSKPTLQRYESGVISNIPSDKIERLAEILETTPSYLMGWEESKKEIKLITEEAKLLNKYNNLDDKGKHTINTVLDMEYNRCVKSYLMPVAAHNDFNNDEEDQKLMQKDLEDMDNNW
ncbi:helix-turn-helix domain-containing protein [Clostridium uliginosum]|uniref:Transcriptional regulator, contains XRE-family HTH domain n=1 Tax=Clostridium uliginosum TaxID=119641 RepID=A0A1I1NPN1_9CLOT|nr:helix-turn-helix transcriptional regulator [Clostridium uliginosum]SFC99385.1 Transcriptional regulator, contains XRE-family HTH domain [Clostridium uliginosum]